MQALIDNWKAIQSTDPGLQRKQNQWLDYKQDIVGELFEPTDIHPELTWVVLGYSHRDYTGGIYYDLFAYNGDSDVGSEECQLETLLDLTTPAEVDFNLLAFGAMSVTEDGEGGLTFLVDGMAIVNLRFTVENQPVVESDILTQRSLDFIQNRVWGVYDSLTQQAAMEGGLGYR